MALQLVHITDKGDVRSSNQDSFCARISSFGQETVALLAVCDGVGGLQAGELASTGAVRCFEDWFEQQLPQIMQSGLTDTMVFLSWHQILENLHNALCEYAERSAMQFGTTVSALLISSDRLYWVQVGDSRIYLDDGAGTEQLTKDQTLAMREVEAGGFRQRQCRQTSGRIFCYSALDMENGTCVPEQTTPTEGRCSVVQ